MTGHDAAGIVLLLLGIAALAHARRRRHWVSRTALVVAHGTGATSVTVQVQAPGYPDLSSLGWDGEGLPSLNRTIPVSHPPDRPSELHFGAAPGPATPMVGGILVADGLAVLLWAG